MNNNPEILRFRIDGMACGACSARSQKALCKMKDIDSATVSLADGTAQVRPAEGALDNGLDAFIQEVTDRVDKLGFKASYLPPDVDEHDLWESEQEKTRADLALRRRRLVTEFIFAVPLVAVAMGSHWGMPLPSWLSPHDSPLIFALFQLLLTLPIIWSGRDFYRHGIPLLLRGAPNMDSLVAMGTGAALLYSLWSTLEIAAAASPGALDRADALLRRLPAASAAFLEAERFPAAWNGVLANLPKTPGGTAGGLSLLVRRVADTALSPRRRTRRFRRLNRLIFACNPSIPELW